MNHAATPVLLTRSNCSGTRRKLRRPPLSRSVSKGGPVKPRLLCPTTWNKNSPTAVTDLEAVTRRSSCRCVGISRSVLNLRCSSSPASSAIAKAVSFPVNRCREYWRSSTGDASKWLASVKSAQPASFRCSGYYMACIFLRTLETAW